MTEAFGTTASGQEVHRIPLTAGELTVHVLTYGAVLQDVRLAGVDHSLTLGSPDLRAYEGAFVSFGSVMGPVANRLTRARAPIGGKEHLIGDDPEAGFILHSGAAGLQHKVWTVEEVSATSLTLAVEAKDGEGGFPGNRRWTARYDLAPPADLTLTITAQTDALTIMNTVNHSYWNLGPGPAHDGHRLRVAAEHFLPVDDAFLPTGEIAPVAGTPFDFRQAREIQPSDALDNNLCLTRARRPLTPVAWLTGPTGITMEMATTEPGLQVYDARHIGGEGFPGHDGTSYGPRAGLALEAQFWPDAPNKPAFPAIDLRPGQPWVQETRWRFGKR